MSESIDGIEGTASKAGLDTKWRSGRPTHPDSQSEALFRRAQGPLVDGYSRLVVRKPFPNYIDHAEGCWAWDVDGKRHIDFTNNFTTLVHGHCHPDIVAAVRRQASLSSCSSMPSPLEIMLAEVLVDRIGSVEQVRFCNTGTEAIMFAVKAAQALAGRPKIAKIEGAFHGQFDLVMPSCWPEPPEWGDAKRPNTVASRPGTPQYLLDHLVVLPCNDIEATRALLADHAEDLAGVVICPIQVQVGYGVPSHAYLAMLREETRRHGMLLIYDEVVALRNGYGGTQEQLGVYPDLTAMGKYIGGGLPIGAIGGTREAMSVFRVEGPGPRVFSHGTFSANPLSLAAGCEAVRLFDRAAVEHLRGLTERLCAGITDVVRANGIRGALRPYGIGMTKLMLTDDEIRDWRDLHAYYARVGKENIERLEELLRKEGVIAVRLSFILSTPMTETDIDVTIGAVDRALQTYTGHASH